MKVKWLAHAAFLLEGDGLRIITDPYVPEVMGPDPITEPADIVIRSSADDRGHCNAAMIRGNPAVVTATEIVGQGITVKGIHVTAVPSQESLIHKDKPLDNAMYCFTLNGIRFAHMGDVGNPLTESQLAGLGHPDVLFALTGGAPTIELDDLDAVIRALNPRIVIPMHYYVPGLKINILPITAFTDRFLAQQVTWIDGSEVELTDAALPQETRIIVLKPSTI